jgi:hypothetical protein
MRLRPPVTFVAAALALSRRLRWQPRLDDKLLAAEMSWGEP